MPEHLNRTIQEERLPEPDYALLAEKLRAVVGSEGVSAGGADRLATCRDYWPMGTLWFLEGKTPALPDLVVWPRSTSAVSYTHLDVYKRQAYINRCISYIISLTISLPIGHKS